MPRKGYTGVPFTLYFSNKSELEALEKTARDNRMTTSGFILDMVRRAQSPGLNPEVGKAEHDAALFCEESQEALKKLKQCQQELNNQKKATETYSKAVADRERVLMTSRDIIKILRQGGTYSNTKIVSLLVADNTNPASMHAIQQALYDLKAMGLVAENIQGWRWHVDEVVFKAPKKNVL
jgi:deferrochelatase/peroxidase EfeB